MVRERGLQHIGKEGIEKSDNLLEFQKKHARYCEVHTIIFKLQ